jgi:hypothetical protein
MIRPWDGMPGVTRIINDTRSESDRAILQRWRDSIGAEQADEINRQSAIDGDLLHMAIKAHLSWGDGMMGAGAILAMIESDTTGARNDRVKVLYNNWRTHVYPRIGEVYALEEHGWNPNHRYAGAIDCIGDFDGVSSVIDWKNSAKFKEEAYIKDYRQQGAAYIGMCYRCPVFKDIPAVKQFVCVVMHDESEEPQVFKYDLDYVLRNEWPLWEQRVKIWHNRNNQEI